MTSQVQEIALVFRYLRITPFYKECRAFGRKIAAGLNGQVAVAYHGNTAIPAEREEEL